MSKIAEYKQISEEIVNVQFPVDDYDEDGIIIGQHMETVEKRVPIMGIVYRDSTPEEDAEAARMAAEYEAEEANREPTTEERFEARLLYLELMTGLLDEEEE